jgi:hypothetical protein
MPIAPGRSPIWGASGKKSIERAAGGALVIGLCCVLACDRESLPSPAAEQPGPPEKIVAAGPPREFNKATADLLAQLVKEKRLDDLKELLSLNGQSGANLKRFGSHLNPLPSSTPGRGNQLSVVQDAARIRAGTRDLVAVAAVAAYEPPPGLGKIGIVPSDAAFLFDSSGSLIAAYGGTVGEDGMNGLIILIGQLGAPGPWFVSVNSPAKSRDLPSVSEVYFCERPTEIALRVRHDFNGSGFFPGTTGRRANPPCMFFAGPAPIRNQMQGTGRDGKRYPKSLRWNSAKQQFYGPASLQDQGFPIFQVDETASKRFLATDGPASGSN